MIACDQNALDTPNAPAASADATAPRPMERAKTKSSAQAAAPSSAESSSTPMAPPEAGGHVKACESSAYSG